jgi:two-component system chemotaxis response regulator CheY
MKTNPKNRNVTVLIVDDMSFIRKVVRKSLADLGIGRIVEASDAAEAVKRLREEKFDLIISDWNMPTMSGYDLLDFVRHNERFKAIPFLMLTANNDKDSVITAAKQGVSDFLVKPFSAEDLEAKVTKLIPPPAT